jgi:hypothetical protein
MAYQGFKHVEDQLAHEDGVDNPAALAASIGRKKYGVQKFDRAAAHGTTLRHALLSKMKKPVQQATSEGLD